MASKMTEAHKKALARGRRQAKAVRDYLEALDKGKRPGRPVSRESLERQIARLHEQIEAEDNPPARVELIQKRLDAESRLEEMDQQPDIDELAKEFAKIAAEYSDRKEISYKAWREAGVPAGVLREAGVPRTRSS